MSKRVAIISMLLGISMAGCGADAGGHWYGTWTGEAGTSGNLDVMIRQSGGGVVGTFSGAGMSCVEVATLTGEVSGDEVKMTVKQTAPNSPDGQPLVELTGKVTDNKMDGTFQMQGRCGAGKGSFQIAR